MITLAIVTIFFIADKIVNADSKPSENWMSKEKTQYWVYRLENDETICYQFSDFNRSGISCFPKK